MNQKTRNEPVIIEVKTPAGIVRRMAVMWAALRDIGDPNAPPVFISPGAPDPLGGLRMLGMFVEDYRIAVYKQIAEAEERAVIERATPADLPDFGRRGQE